MRHDHACGDFVTTSTFEPAAHAQLSIYELMVARMLACMHACCGPKNRAFALACCTMLSCEAHGDSSLDLA